jgi:hypothetical protein
MLLKRLACMFLALTLGLQPLASQAIDLGEAFGSIVPSGSTANINSPGRFSSSARSGITAGGVEIRVPRGNSNLQLLSVDMPHISAGCGGISAHFGGFSFISGAEFANILKQIASGVAMGFVSSLVMKTLCPPCQAVVEELRAAAQAAARLARDSCAIGQAWGDRFMSGLGSSTDKPATCASVTSSSNQSSDFLDGFAGAACSTLQSATKSLNSIHDGMLPSEVKGDPQKRDAANASQCLAEQGNMTWKRLSAFEGGMFSTLSKDVNSRKLILMNLMGARMTYQGATGDAIPPVVACQLGGGGWTKTSEGKPEVYCPPPADTKKFVTYFMCGASPSALSTQPGSYPYSTTIRNYCKDLGDNLTGESGNKVWACKSTLNGDTDLAGCPVLQLTEASELFTGTGFLLSINQLLREGVARVRNRQKDMTQDPRGRQIMALIDAAPFPLYQALNAAAVYPGAADDLLDSMSVQVAEQFTYGVFDDMLRLQGRASADSCISEAQATKILDFMGSMRAQVQANRTVMAQNFQVQQALTEQIRSINQAIQKQVMSTDLLANGQMTQSMNKALSPNVSAVKKAGQ